MSDESVLAPEVDVHDQWQSAAHQIITSGMARAHADTRIQPNAVARIVEGTMHALLGHLLIGPHQYAEQLAAQKAAAAPAPSDGAESGPDGSEGAPVEPEAT